MSNQGAQNIPLWMPDAAARAMRRQQMANQQFAQSSMSYENAPYMLPKASAQATAAAAAAPDGDELDALLNKGSNSDIDWSGFLGLPETRAFAALAYNSKELLPKIKAALKSGESLTILAPNNKAMAELHETLKKPENAGARNRFVAEHMVPNLETKMMYAEAEMSGSGDRSLFPEAAALVVDTFSEHPEGRGVAFTEMDNGSTNVTLYNDARKVMGAAEIESVHIYPKQNIKVQVLNSTLRG